MKVSLGKMKVSLGKFPKGNSERKIDIQIDKWDTWNMDHTIALLIYPLLVQLRDTKHGVPSDFAFVGGGDGEQQESFEFYKETYDWAFNKGCEKWDEALDKMIWSFYQIAYNDIDDQYTHGEPKFEFKKIDNHGSTSLVQLNEDYWFDSVGSQLANEKIQEGLDLFGKYFLSLWD